jgi:hypothetical protein
MLYSRILRGVAVVRTDVSQEPIASHKDEKNHEARNDVSSN